MPCSATTAVRRPRAGLSLLEVLVACGILVIGLTSIAAVLPAAGSRLGQAAQADRGGTLVANAYAEALTRGLVAADMFSQPARACVFGTGLGAAPAASAAAGNVMAVASSGVLAARIDTARGFLLDDDLRYTAGAAFELPVNVVTSGTRAFNEGLCWGGMIACNGNAASGTPGTLSIAVFKKDPGSPAALTLTLTGSVGNTFQLTTGTANGLVDDGTRKQYLPACGYVLATTSPPQWLRVQSSWAVPGPIVSGTEVVAARKSYVVLDRNPGLGGTTLPVIAFEQLLRVDQFPVTLD
jgi:hypothetical protein